MSKFALLLIFLAISISWLNHPFSIDPNDAIIDKHRPSLLRSPNTIRDSIRPVHTTYYPEATAFYTPKVAKE